MEQLSRRALIDACAKIPDDLADEIIADTPDAEHEAAYQALRAAAIIIRAFKGEAAKVSDSHLHKFRKWREKNPTVIALVDKIIDELAATRKHYAIQAVIERIRYHSTIKTTDDWCEFKLNAQHTAYIIREHIRRYPERRDMFTLKALGSADDNAYYAEKGIKPNEPRERKEEAA